MALRVLVSGVKCLYSTTWKAAFCCLVFPTLVVLVLPLWLAGLAYNLLVRLWIKVSNQTSDLRVMRGPDAFYCSLALDPQPVVGVLLTFKGDIDVERVKILGRHLFACGQLGPKKDDDVELLERHLDNVTLQTVQRMRFFPTVKYGLYMWKRDPLFDFNNHITSTDK
jgi:hypothetical protein